MKEGRILDKRRAHQCGFSTFYHFDVKVNEMKDECPPLQGHCGRTEKGIDLRFGGVLD